VKGRLPHLFSSTLGQILLICACSSVVTFLLFLAILFNPGRPPNVPWPWQTTFRVASVIRVIERTRAPDRAAIAASLDQSDITFRVRAAPTPCGLVTLDTEELTRAFAYELPDGPRVEVRSCSQRDPRSDILITTRIGDTVLEARSLSSNLETTRISVPFFGALGFMCVGVIAMSAWAVARVIRPLRRLADKADAFGHDLAPAPIAEEGPREIRRVARAFNLMQERIALSLHSRTRMLAAVSHDLRTPLTRMRLQIDTNAGDTMREKLRRDIDLMQTMVSSALTYLRTGTEQENKEWLDLAALIATLCDEYEEGGAAVSYQVPDELHFFCRPDALHRVLTNLIDNALRYGREVVVEASVDGRHTVIDVDDDGPGIPEERLKDVLEPFVRLDPARGGQLGNIGLGLAIVKDIVQAHGGSLALTNLQPCGLRARVTLPRSRENGETSLIRDDSAGATTHRHT
jgi:signal transduction histidine kinase